MIAAYLSDQGVDVNPLLISGARMVWKGNELRIDVRPFIRGRHYDGSREDLAHLATAMAHCHQSLASFPEPVRVQEIAASRYERHDNVRQLIADCLVNGSFDALFGERAQWAFRHRDWLEEMVDNFHPRFDLIPNAQCLHGQIHPANVLYRVGDGRPILVDWEEAIQVFAPRVYDLAYMVQRFCLHDNPSAEMIQQRLDVVASSYGSLPPLAPMMRQLSWYSMAVILETEVFHGIRVSQTEYEKFVRLERQARTLVGVL
jgi:Ser/Thr protein kinase RdoA (MazF antagonist)